MVKRLLIVFLSVSNLLANLVGDFIFLKSKGSNAGYLLLLLMLLLFCIFLFKKRKGRSLVNFIFRYGLFFCILLGIHILKFQCFSWLLDLLSLSGFLICCVSGASSFGSGENQGPLLPGQPAQPLHTHPPEPEESVSSSPALIPPYPFGSLSDCASSSHPAPYHQPPAPPEPGESDENDLLRAVNQFRRPTPNPIPVQDEAHQLVHGGAPQVGIPQEDGAEHLPVIPVGGEGQEEALPNEADYEEVVRRNTYLICENARLRGKIALNQILLSLRISLPKRD